MDNFYDVEEKGEAGNEYAKQVMQSWADAEWFLNRPALAEKLTVTVFKVTGETNTDDLSPAPDAWSRPISHCMRWRCSKTPAKVSSRSAGRGGPIKQIEALQQKAGVSVTLSGPARKSATNSAVYRAMA